MNFDVDAHILQLNFLEFLTNFLEGEVDLSIILQVNERIYTRDHAILPEPLLSVSTQLHKLKERLDTGENIDKDTILNIVNDCVIKLIDESANGSY